MTVVNFVAMSVCANITAAVAASKYKRIIQRAPKMISNPLEVKMLSTTEKRMAFYANILDGEQLTLNEKEAREWRRDLPKAMEAQYALIDRGALPVVMSLENVRKLSAHHRRSDKTLE